MLTSQQADTTWLTFQTQWESRSMLVLVYNLVLPLLKSHGSPWITFNKKAKCIQRFTTILKTKKWSYYVVPTINSKVYDK